MTLIPTKTFRNRTYYKKPLKERIFEKRRITEAGCWEYTGCLNKQGYGIAQKGKDEGGTVLVHRFVMGEPEGHVLHKCHNSACFNPEHLYVGDQADNTADMMYAGRVDHYKLTQQDADNIRESYEFRKTTMKDLAASYGVSEITIFRVLHNQAWVWN